MTLILESPWMAVLQAMAALIGTWLLAFGLKSVREAHGFDTRKPSPASWRFWTGLGMLSLSLGVAGLSPFAAAKPISPPASPVTAVGTTQPALAPISGTELWHLRSECVRLGEKILEGNLHGSAIAQDQESHYSLKDGRCYVQLEVYPADATAVGDRRTYLFDGQTRVVVARMTDPGRDSRRDCGGWLQSEGAVSCERAWEIISAAMQE